MSGDAGFGAAVVGRELEASLIYIPHTARVAADGGKTEMEVTTTVERSRLGVKREIDAAEMASADKPWVPRHEGAMPDADS